MLIRKVNLQLFAEDTNPGSGEDVNLENQPEKNKEPARNPFERLYKGEFSKKEPDKKAPDIKEPEEKKPEQKDEKKPEETKEPEEVKEPDTKEPETQKDEEFIEINHLGKKVQIPAADRDKYLQMGYDYTYVKGEHEKSKAALKRIAALEGFNTVEEYLAELDNREKAKLAEQIEEAAGDPKAIDSIIQNHPLVRQTQEEKQRIEEEKQKLAYERKIEELRKEEFFKELEPELKRLLEQNPNVEPSLAYSVLVGNYVRTGKLNELVKKTKESAEKKVIADVHDKERRAAPTGGDSADGKDFVQQTDFGRQLSGIFRLSKDAAQRAAQRAHEKLKRS